MEMNQQILIVVQHQEDCLRVAKLVRVLYAGAFDCEIRHVCREQHVLVGNGTRIIAASVDTWSESTTCGKNWDKVVFLCEPPDRIIEQVQHCLVFSEEEERIVK